MATKKTTAKISDKMSRVSDSFSISMYDNGFLFDISGRDDNDEWKSAKIVVTSVEELVTLIKEATSLERE